VARTASETMDREEHREAFDWLTYRHWRCLRNPMADRRIAVSDNDGYNQGISREMQLVTDLILSCQLEINGGSRLAVLAHDGRERSYVYLDPRGHDLTVHRGSTRVCRPQSSGLMRNRPL